MAKINPIGNKTGDLTIDPGAAGDSVVKFEINTTSEFTIGVDDDAGDSFKVSQGGVLGANDTFVMTAAGERTMPLQAAFLAKRDSDLTDVTGDGTAYTSIVFDNEIFDQNGDYNNGTGVFTAPIAGRYVFGVGLALEDLAAGHTRLAVYPITTSSTYYLLDIDGAAVRDAANDFYFSALFYADMDALDTATVNLIVTGGALVIDIIGDGTTEKLSWFSGYLAT